MVAEQRANTYAAIRQASREIWRVMLPGTWRAARSDPRRSPRLSSSRSWWNSRPGRPDVSWRLHRAYKGCPRPRPRHPRSPHRPRPRRWARRARSSMATSSWALQQNSRSVRRSTQYSRCRRGRRNCRSRTYCLYRASHTRYPGNLLTMVSFDPVSRSTCSWLKTLIIKISFLKRILKRQ